MESYGMDQKLVRLIKAFYSETQLAVLVNGHLSEWFQMTLILSVDKEIHCHHDHFLCSWRE